MKVCGVDPHAYMLQVLPRLDDLVCRNDIEMALISLIGIKLVIVLMGYFAERKEVTQFESTG
ncbi:MAG: hypothetical protein BMS9Abin15_0687 [Gammaproteobacteria bacterium]|nr:MAG: hypothetical protein BMS9Abin15_0687 [Gammaproteobacteria bacterium]